ncbi:hypothetical protein OsJ_00902 [Oryza sativa Japonica Group]|uniref:DUF7890 domain-containing protein n=1 Tax=Oryza sativa subsp. japonica TaxID=39947 RepID=A2ZQR1_ORYSJ|nr:hypothetical protein OsJ_00902 [Oryza sativa Japonica Group]
MNPKQRLYSLKLLVKALHKLKKKMMMKPNKGKKIGSSKPSSPAAPAEAASATAAAVAGGGVEAAIGEQKGVVRVKVVLTKEEAARLLSLTVVSAGAGAGGGRRKTTAQIIAEIKRMEIRRAMATSSAAVAWRPALASIPEEQHHHSPRRSLGVQQVA